MATRIDADQLLESLIKRGLPGCSLHVVQRSKTLYEVTTGSDFSKLMQMLAWGLGNE